MGALTSVSNEVTLAVAQFNMDFTLMKVEAPQEYQGLGSALSPSRREQAEVGLTHTTARKLGALFEHIIPDTPRLYRAYGQRSSDIAMSDSAHGTISRTGPFSAHEGLDGTSIWAAATSGKRAIAMHLLGCMLSKIWKGPEAISVWVELVARRKSEILACLDEGSMQTTASLMAARQEITRANLAAWDASARAWLQTADEANQVRQTQLRLVLDNISIPVNNQADLYRSVLKAWTNALVMVENLVAGMPQSVNDGGVLLALSAWHLYPDMLVLGSTTTRVEQNDPLVGPGGILTIGLHHNGDIGRGVFWSLPLAHMRYYGDAPIVSRSLAADSSRISFEQLYQVTLGCLSAQWNLPLQDVAKIITTLLSVLSTQRKPLDIHAQPEGEDSSQASNDADNRTGHGSEAPSQVEESDTPARHRTEYPIPAGDINTEQSVCLTKGHWFSTLSEAANISQRAWGQDKELFTKLGRFGARRGTSFLNGHSETSQHSFGLCDLSTLLRQANGVEARVELLRNISKGFPLPPDDIFIRYRTSEKTKYRLAYASAIPHRFETLKRSLDGNQRTVESHIRWTYYHPELISARNKQSARTQANAGYPTQLNPFPWDEYQRHIEALRLTTEKCYFVQVPSIRESGEFTLAWREYGKERYMLDENDIFENSTDQEYVYPGAYEGGETDVTEFDFLMGDFGLAGLFIRKGSALDRYKSYGHGSDATTDELVNALNGMLIDPKKLDKYLHTWGLGRAIHDPATMNVSVSLRSLAAVNSFYNELTYATVNLAVVSQPLHKAKWMQEVMILDSMRIELDLPQRFSCIAMFESGIFNIAPEHLHRVMALAVGNSIYVADFLQHEPHVYRSGHKQAWGITRITGSLGRSEMAMLVSPGTPPPLKALDYKNWNVVNHSAFKGNCHDCFQNTTLHLSFTDFDMPVDVGTRGIRDTEVILIESVVSLHDRGDWVGDLDIISAMASQSLSWASPPKCSATPEERCETNSNSVPSMKLVSIDNWDELLDMPSENMIIRAHGNWLARLAAATISIQKKRRTIFLPPDTCWHCLSRDSSIWKDSDMVSLIC